MHIWAGVGQGPIWGPNLVWSGPGARPWIGDQRSGAKDIFQKIWAVVGLVGFTMVPDVKSALLGQGWTGTHLGPNIGLGGVGAEDP